MDTQERKYLGFDDYVQKSKAEFFQRLKLEAQKELEKLKKKRKKK